MTPLDKFETEKQPKKPNGFFKALRRLASHETKPTPIKESSLKMEQIPGQPDWYPQNLHITIDDGPNLNYLGNILAVLKEYKVKATFFFVGTSLRRYLKSKEKAPILKKLLKQLLEDGHQIGYHCYAHCHTEAVAKTHKECNDTSFDTMSRREIEADFHKFKKCLKKPWKTVTTSA